MKKTPVFFISKENWRRTESTFIGYKLFEKDGVWINIENKKTHIEIIESVFAPVIYLYSKGKDFAVSNSLQKIVRTYNLEKTRNVPQVSKKNNYEICETEYENVSIVGLNNIIYINDELKLRADNYKFFSENFDPDLINRWYLKYSSLIRNNDGDVYTSLSGGSDSRICFKMALGGNIKAVFSIRSKDAEPEYPIIDKVLKCEGKEHLLVHELNARKKSLWLEGYGTESLKSPSIINKIGNIDFWRKNQCNKMLEFYYTSGCKKIAPFLDSLILGIKTTKERMIIDYIYDTFFPKAKLIPFFNSDKNMRYYYDYDHYYEFMKKYYSEDNVDSKNRGEAKNDFGKKSAW